VNDLGDEVPSPGPFFHGRAIGFFCVRADGCSGVENLIRKCTRDRASAMQKLHCANHVAGEDKEAILEIERLGASGRDEAAHVLAKCRRFRFGH